MTRGALMFGLHERFREEAFGCALEISRSVLTLHISTVLGIALSITFVSQTVG